MGRVEHKVAVVTGGASGIGFAASRLLAAEGAAVVIGDLELEKAAAAAEEIKRDGGRALGVALDAMDEASIGDLVQAAVDEFGALHVMCNHVGGSNPRKDLDAMRLDLDEFDRVMRGERAQYCRRLSGGPTAPDCRWRGIDHQHRIGRRALG